MDLFENWMSQNRTVGFAPLADEVRPESLEDFFGHQGFSSESAPLIRQLDQQGFLPNLILWGPPGTGKTTFAHILAKRSGFRFVDRNAISTGAKELREIGLECRHMKTVDGKKNHFVCRRDSSA
jgi:putative ATPase